MHQLRFGARSEYRLQEGQRVKDAATLASTFAKLKSLTVQLEHRDAQGGNKGSEVKYTVNIQNAKSVIRFDCPNTECVRGDFDLSDELAKAVREKRKTVSGEKVCQGWRSKVTIDSVPCHNVLRYKLTLGY